MIFTKSIICKLFLLTLVICCLTRADAAKIPKNKTKSIAKQEITTQKSEVVANDSGDEDADTDADADDDDDGDDDDDDDDENDDETSSEETTNAAEKNALQPAAPSSLSVWGIVRGVWNWIKADLTEGLFGEDDATTAVGEGRTFGKIRRLQMALIPIVFKFGVLTAMVAFLVAIGLKTLFFVKMLLAMNALVLLSKFFTLKTNFGHSEHSAPPSWGWSPHMSSGWSSAPAVVAAAPEHHPSKEIHLHIHGAQGQPQVQAYSSYSAGPQQQQQSHGWERRNDPYSAYDNLALHDQNDVASSAIPVTQQVNANYASNHRMF